MAGLHRTGPGSLRSRCTSKQKSPWTPRLYRVTGALAEDPYEGWAKAHDLPGVGTARPPESPGQPSQFWVDAPRTSGGPTGTRA